MWATNESLKIETVIWELSFFLGNGYCIPDFFYQKIESGQLLHSSASGHKHLCSLLVESQNEIRFKLNITNIS
jgi:hypothetical protein